MVWEDVFVYGVVLFAFGLIVALAWGAVGVLMPNVAFIAQNYTVNGTTISPLNFMTLALNTFDWLFLFFAIIMAVALFLSAYFLPSHPAFTIIGAVMALIWVWITPYIANTWITLLQESVLVGFEARFPFITAFILYLPTIGFFAGLVAMIIFYGKPSRTIAAE